MSATNIKVVCRVRPLNDLEKSLGGKCCLGLDDKSVKIELETEGASHSFTFDKVFGANSRQIDVFEVAAKPTVEGLMSGFNGTIFAYGQTSSGKTHTMEGPSVEDDEMKGIIPRIMDSVFECILQADEKLEFTVRSSFLEIYNEKVQDLLDPRKNNLQIKEDRSGSIYVADSTEICVTSVDDMRKVMAKGSSNRTIAATRMNEKSSRSHSIFVISISQKNLETGTTSSSKLHLIDLAGSEKVAKTNASGQQLKEANNINKSLTTLGMVIKALTSEKIDYIPYRDSKLTRLLQESLGGNSRTTLIINCSMCSYNDKETLSTLRFGMRAKSIKNTPMKNEEKSAKELKSLLSKAEERLKAQEELIKSLEGGSTPNPSVNQPAQISQSGAAAIFKLNFEISKLKSLLCESQKENKDLQGELESSKDDLKSYENEFSAIVNYYMGFVSHLQLKFEQIYKDCQEFFASLTKIKKNMTSLKSEMAENLFGSMINREGSGFMFSEQATSDIESIDELSKRVDTRMNEYLEIKIEPSSDGDFRRTPRTYSCGLQTEDNSDTITIPTVKSEENDKKVSNILKNKYVFKDGESVSSSNEEEKLFDDKIFSYRAHPTSKLCETCTDKVHEFTDLISSQRKIIDELKKQNSELMNQNPEANSRMRKKILEMSNYSSNKQIEFNQQIISLKQEQKSSEHKLHEKISLLNTEIGNLHSFINELKLHNEKMQQMLTGKETTKNYLEVSKKLKGLAYEKQLLFNEVSRLKGIENSFNESLAEKEKTISLLQSQINSLKNENTRFKLQEKAGNFSIPSFPQKSWKPAIVKTLRGGGGSYKNFMKANYLKTLEVDEEVSSEEIEEEEEKKFEESPKIPKRNSRYFRETIEADRKLKNLHEKVRKSTGVASMIKSWLF